MAFLICAYLSNYWMLRNKNKKRSIIGKNQFSSHNFLSPGTQWANYFAKRRQREKDAISAPNQISSQRKLNNQNGQLLWAVDEVCLRLDIIKPPGVCIRRSINLYPQGIKTFYIYQKKNDMMHFQFLQVRNVLYKAKRISIDNNPG